MIKFTATLNMDGLAGKLTVTRDAKRAALKESLPQAAALLVEEAQALVRVDTGNLRAHIHANHVDEEDAKQTMQVVPFDEAANEYGFDPAYARRIEYGFFQTDRLGRSYHQAAQPYMRPTRDGKGPEAVGLIKQAVVSA